MEIIAILIPLVQLLIGLLALFALIEIFHIGATLKQILAAVKKADERRREEFNAVTAE